MSLQARFWAELTGCVPELVLQAGVLLLVLLDREPAHKQRGSVWTPGAPAGSSCSEGLVLVQSHSRRAGDPPLALPDECFLSFTLPPPHMLLLLLLEPPH